MSVRVVQLQALSQSEGQVVLVSARALSGRSGQGPARRTHPLPTRADTLQAQRARADRRRSQGGVAQAWGGKSPDRADSVMLAFAVRHDPVDALVDYYFPRFEGTRNRSSLISLQFQAIMVIQLGVVSAHRYQNAESAGEVARPEPLAEGALSHLVIQQCPRCGQVPSVYEHATCQNGVPTRHQNCRT
jgi:hypothetical protein